MSRRAPRVVVAVAAAAALAAVVSPARAQLTLEHSGPDTLTVGPGDRASIAFRISNAGPAAASGRLAAELPEGWRAITPAAEVQVPSGASAVRVVSFYPSSEAAGVYPLRVELSGAGATASRTVHVRVPEVIALELEVVEAPTWATAGETYEIVARLTNRGNAAASFKVSIASPYGVPAETGTAGGSLEAGEARDLHVTVSPQKDLPRAITHALRIVAAADTARAEAVAPVEILPAPHARSATPGGIPAELRFRASADPRAGPPVRLQAAGPIRPGSETRIAALLQGPTRAYSIFGEPDVYRLGIQSPRFSLDLGDNPFRLSRLTEPGKQGFGAAGSARLGGLSVGGYAQLDRRSFSPDTQFAAFAGLSASRNATIRGNWLRTHADEGRREVVSAEGLIQVPRWFSLRGEVGVRPDRGAQASTAELAAHRGPIALSLRHLEADTAYGGTQAGLSTRSAHLSLRPWGELYVDGSVQDQSTERSVEATRFESLQRTMRVATGWGSRFALEGHAVERRARAGPTENGHTARSIRLRLGVPLGGLMVYPSLEHGVGQDLDAAEPQPFWRAGARSSFRAANVALSSNLEYFTGGTLHRTVVEEGLTGVATAAIRIGGTELRASAHATRYLAPVTRDNMVLDATITQDLPFGHEISARVIRRASDGLFQHDDVLALLDYSVPLRIPTGSGDGGASVTAEVRDALTGEPLPRVIVQVGGRRVATDRNGRVTIRGLEPGVHYLDVDRATTGSGLVPTVPVPVRLDLEAGDRRGVELALVRGGAMVVHASITRASSASGLRGPAEPEPFERVLVELELGEQRIRRQTDRRGTIELSGLRPGLWTVRIADAELPSFHRFDRDSALVEVVGGRRAEVSFSAAPVRRRIEIVATADLTERRAGEETEAVSAPAPSAAAPRPTEPIGAEPPARGAAPVLGEPARAGRRESRPVVALGEPVDAPPARSSASGRPLGEPAPARPQAPAARAPERARATPAAEERARGYTITVVAGDRSLRNIAALVYGDRDLWPRIFLANVGVVRHPDELFAGQVLRIPPAGPLTPEERAIARRFPERE